jgi:hypothetical protein
MSRSRRDHLLAALRRLSHLFSAGLSDSACLPQCPRLSHRRRDGRSDKDRVQLGALQFAAEVHELLIHSSITTMVVSCIRYGLTVSLRLPFNALVSGHRFSELGCF